MKARAGSTRLFGYTICVLGVLAVGPDAALLRTQHLAGGSTTVISVWRYVFLSICNLGAAFIFEGTPAKLIEGASKSVWQLVFASCLIIFINMGFTISLLKCDAAKALLLISLNPLWAALMGKLLLGDSLAMRTVVAQALSLVSCLLVFVPALSTVFGSESLSSLVALAAAASEDGGDGDSSGSLFNTLDLVPLFTGFTVAGLLTFSRWQSHASLELAPCGGAVLTAVAAMVYLQCFDEEPIEALVLGLGWRFWAALCASALGSAVYDSALVIAPRSLSSAEVALILLGETVRHPASFSMRTARPPARARTPYASISLLPPRPLVMHRSLGRFGCG